MQLVLACFHEVKLVAMFIAHSAGVVTATKNRGSAPRQVGLF